MMTRSVLLLSMLYAPGLLRLMHKTQGVFCHGTQRALTVLPFAMLHYVVGLVREFSRKGIAADQSINTCSVRKDISHARVVDFAAAFEESDSAVQLLFQFLVLTVVKEECSSFVHGSIVLGCPSPSTLARVSITLLSI